MASQLLDMNRRRNGLAVRLAVIEAASDKAVLDAAEDYATRVAADRPYESAEPAEELLGGCVQALRSPVPGGGNFACDGCRRDERRETT